MSDDNVALTLGNKMAVERNRLWRCVAVVLFMIVFTIEGLAAVPQTDADSKTRKTAVNWRAERILLHRKFGSEIQELAFWCRDNGIEEQVPATFRVYRNFQLDRQYIFLPTEKKMPVASVKGLAATWLEKLNNIKRAHAARLFELAKRAADGDAYGFAFQLIHEVIYYDRDHEEARRILNHKRLKDGTWRIHSETVKKPRTSSRQHDIVSWPAGSFFTVNTPHFQIDSNASKKETEFLAQKLEKWHYAWREVFFEYWAKAWLVKKWLGGEGSLKIPRKRFRVIFFRDHEDYVEQVQPLQPGIENSAGYYNGDYKVSFFPATNADGQRDAATWRHELNHQLFRETIRTRNQPFADHFLWLDEGVAMYFESLRGEGQMLTLGGFDSQRLQYSRWRRLRENYHVPISELAEMDMRTFQRRSDLPLLYAESAGIAHMLMDSREYDTLPVLLRFMKKIHEEKVPPELFAKMIGRSLEELDDDYLKFLEVESRDVEKRIEYIQTVSQLAAMNADLRESAFDVIGDCINLRELDLTGSDFTKKRAIKLQQLDLLSVLYLNNCVIESGALRPLGQLESLKQLDLASSSIDDTLLGELQRLPNLKSLQIANTKVTDKGLIQLAKLPKLKVLDVTGSQVSAQGVARFKELRTDVKVLLTLFSGNNSGNFSASFVGSVTQHSLSGPPASFLRVPFRPRSELSSGSRSALPRR